MNFTFLGTSSGVPTQQRNVTALAIAPKNSKRWYLVDCGEATQHQLLKTPLSLIQLQAIMITHIHGDHCYGLPGLLATAGTYGRSEKLVIIAPAAIQLYVHAVCQHTTLTLPYPIEFIAVETLENHYLTKDFAVSRIALSHRVPSYAYKLAEINVQEKLDTQKLRHTGIQPGPVWGKIQKGENVILERGQQLIAKDYYLPKKHRQVIIGGDNDQPELLMGAASTADLLIHEATFTEAVAAEVGPGPQHSSAASVARFAEKAQLKNLILTHFSQRYHRPHGTSIEAIRIEAQKFYLGCLHLANDLDVFELSSEGQLILLNSAASAIPSLAD